GTIFDFAIFGLLYENTQWYNIIIIGIINAVVFYFVFRYLIIKFDIKTPGREDEVQDARLLNEKRYGEIAELVVQGLGGSGNIEHVDNCVSRLRIDIKNNELVDKDILKSSGASGIFFPKKNHIHIVYGPHVEFVKNEVDGYLKTY